MIAVVRTLTAAYHVVLLPAPIVYVRHGADLDAFEEQLVELVPHDGAGACAR